MILNNATIKKLSSSGKLIINFQEDGLQYCSYKFHVGKIIVPSDGTVLESFYLNKKLSCLEKILQSVSNYLSQQKKCDRKDHGFVVKNEKYILKPREIVLFQTAEEVKMPNNIMALYTSLNSIAIKGILLINSSTIEPNYEGPLSGILLNFSNKDFEMSSNMPIAKGTFHTIEEGVTQMPAIINKINVIDYTENLRKRSKDNYDRSFLSIKELGSEIEDNLNRRVIKSLSIGGFILALLLAFSTLQPFVYNCFWGVPSYQVSDRKAHVEYLQIKDAERKELDQLIQQIDSLKQILILKQKDQNGQNNTQPPRGI